MAIISQCGVHQHLISTPEHIKEGKQVPHTTEQLQTSGLLQRVFSLLRICSDSYTERFFFSIQAVLLKMYLSLLCFQVSWR